MARSSGVALLAAALLLFVGGGAGSAPAPVSPEPPGSPDIDRYLYDDTDSLAVIDVKATLRVPAVKVLLANPLLTAAAGQNGVFGVLGDCGVNLSRDVDRVVSLTAPSCHPAGSTETGGLTLVQGRFDAAAMRQKLAGLVRAGKVEEQAVPRGKVYRVKGNPAGYVALLDNATLAISSTKQVAADAVARAGTLRRPALKHKEMARFLKSIKPGHPAQVLLLDSFVMSSSGAGAAVKRTTLGDSNVRSVLVRVESDKEVRTLVDLTCKAAADADTMTGQVQAALALLPQALKGHPNAQQLGPAVKLVEGIKVKSEGSSCIIESKVEQKMLTEAVQALLKLAP